MPILDAVIVACDHPDCRAVWITGKGWDPSRTRLVLSCLAESQWVLVYGAEAELVRAYCPAHAADAEAVPSSLPTDVTAPATATSLAAATIAREVP